MDLYRSKTYLDDLKIAVDASVNLQQLKNKSVMITGASGLIGSFIADTLLMYNKEENAGIKIIALGRSSERLKKRFKGFDSGCITYIENNIMNQIECNCDVDYIIHAAGNAYPMLFANDPVGTLIGCITGTENVLNYGFTHNVKRVLYVSSGEIYGQGSNDTDKYSEDYSGYVDPISVRSCYPTGKRAAENLCCAFSNQYGLDTVIARPCHTYGACISEGDNRANAQFILNAAEGKDIVMNSSGSSFRSYCYIADCVSGLLTVLINGQCGQAYNIANPDSMITIAEFAKIAAEKSGCKLLFASPDKAQKAQMSPISRQVLCSRKLTMLGWQGVFSADEGIRHTLDIFKECK